MRTDVHDFIFPKRSDTVCHVVWKGTLMSQQSSTFKKLTTHSWKAEIYIDRNFAKEKIYWD